MPAPIVLPNNRSGSTRSGAAPHETPVQLTAATNRPASPASTAPDRSPCRAARKRSRTTRRSNNPHSSAIRGFVQSGFDEVAPAHAEDLVRDLTEASRFNSRVRRTAAGVFHHISPEHADLYFHEMGYRWSQRVIAGQTTRRSPRGRERVRTLWDRIPPAMQLVAVLRTAVDRQLRRTRNGSISIKSPIAAFCL
ncbi:MAG: transposase [Rhodospirillales bacterium]|nr:transposase [Rhodospirillales bacterium]MBK8176679.1 transposase [Rhodospirillales bacterium]